MITLKIDDHKIQAVAGTNLLETCLDNDIYIPNLCYLAGMPHPPVSCRLCFVEIESTDYPVCACSVRVDRRMAIRTDTPQVRRLQKTGLKLLLSTHEVDCKNCPANRQCPLQNMAKFLKAALNNRGFEQLLKATRIDPSHPCWDHYPNRCVLCGKCVHVCRQQQHRVGLTFAGRGIDTVIDYYDRPQSSSPPCENCRACMDVCPVAALLPKS
jgi:NADH dehydrogenase/NADH:ubiquinone oxidoreductase subunit G